MGDGRSAARSDLAAALALLTVVLLTCLPTLWRAYVHDDFRVYYLPVRAFFAAGLQHGELRWWCSEMGAGFPLFAEGQAGFLHPSTLLAYLFLPPWLTLSLTVILNLLLGASGVYACLRQRRVQRMAAVAGGLVYALSGPVLFRAIHLGFFQGLCALPWVLWGLERGFRGERHGYLALAVALALVCVAGHPHPALIAMLLVPGYAVARLAARSRDSAQAPSPAPAGEGLGGGRTDATPDEPAPLPPPPAPQGEEPDRLRAVVGVSAAVLLAGLFAAAQWLPTAELVPHTERSGALSVQRALDISLEPAQLWALVTGGWHAEGVARALGWGTVPHWEWCPHVGLLPFLLAALAPLLGFRRERWAWWVAGLLVLLLCMAHTTPLYALLRRLPGWSSVRGPARLLGLFALCAAMLTGLTLDDLSARPPARRAGLYAMGLLWLVLLSVIAEGELFLRRVWSILRGLPSGYAYHGLRATAMLLAAVLLVAAARPLARARSRGWWLPAGLALVALDLFSGSRGYEPLAAPSFYAPTAEVAEARRPGGARILAGVYEPGALEANRHLLYPGVSNFELYTPLTLQRWRRLDDALRHGLPTGDAAAVRWLQMLRVERLHQGLLFPGAPGAERLAPPSTLPALPWFWVAPRCRQAVGEEALKRTLEPGWSPLAEALVETPTIASSPAFPGSVTAAWIGRHRLTAEVRGGPQALVLSQAWCPGWWAMVDGRWQPAERVDYLLTGVRLSAGEHRVRFVYRPMSLRLGLWLALLGLAVVAGVPASGSRW